MLVDPMTGLLVVVNDSPEDEDLPAMTNEQFDALFGDDDAFVESKQTKGPAQEKRIWTIESLKSLAEFILLDEKRVVQNQRLRLFQLAIENDVYVDIEFQKQESDMKAALSDIIIDKKAVICYNGGLWPIMTVQARSAVLKELSKKSKEATMQKESLKSMVKELNVTYANELTQQMAKNWHDVQKERLNHMLAIARIDKETRQKNLEAWISFLKEVDEGTGRDVLEGRAAEERRAEEEGKER